MPKAESTILDYTKSVEELRLFELSEKCREIAREYESYNIRNGIYEAFGEWFLEEAKDSYSTEFSSHDLAQIIRKKDIEPPKVFLVERKYGDYDKCESLREICVNVGITTCRCESNYAWYTMWQIAKAYNGKHGCVVTEPPNYDCSYGGMIKISIDWSQDAVDCTTNEKWRMEAEKEELGVIASGFFGDLIWLFVWLVLALAIAITQERFIGFKTYLIPFIPIFVLFSTTIRSLSIKSYTKKLSKEYVKHCQNIKETKYSKFNVYAGKITRAGYM